MATEHIVHAVSFRQEGAVLVLVYVIIAAAFWALEDPQDMS